MQLEQEREIDYSLYQQNLPQFYKATVNDFKKVSKSFVTFNLVFSLAITIELILFFSFLPLLTKSSWIAISIGSLIVTCFTYVILYFYFQARKPDHFLDLKNRLIQSCKIILSVPAGLSTHHLSIASTLNKLSSYLQDFEQNFYRIPSFLTPYTSWINAFSEFAYKEDVQMMQKILLEASIIEHMQQIKSTPTDLEVHASLGFTYVNLSKLLKKANLESEFNKIASLAIEEFTILSQYAPNDPWVHEQLANGYHDLNMFDEEIKEMEILQNLKSNDKEILYKLGILYFKKGLNAKGLKIYEDLLTSYAHKAEDLIQYYGQHH
jgi:hypothetical protein